MAKGKKRVLVVEPFGGGSHAAFYRNWMHASRHHFTVLELPAVHWKWRSRHSSLTLALKAKELYAQGQRFDALLCSDMLNLPEWRGFSGELASLPTIAYFHENQFTYPLAAGQSRDYHFAYSNILTAISATQVWFNSTYHRDEFLEAACNWLHRMPDFKHVELFSESIASAMVCPPGISAEHIVARDANRYAERPLTIGWVARWEHDKGPEIFEKAILDLVQRDLPFQLILLGQQFRTPHPSFDAIVSAAKSRVLHAGYATDRGEYWQLLSQIDVVVSSAHHEFWGIGVLEAVAAGAIPLLPARLAYPEVFELEKYPERRSLFYSGTAADLTERLATMIPRHPLHSEPAVLQRSLDFSWSKLAPQYDDYLDAMLETDPKDAHC